jgi:hypothetical protein
VSRRSRIVAAQAALVALLVLAVYLWLLQPESTGPLHGIKTPGEGVEHAERHGAQGGTHHRAHHRAGQNGGAGGAHAGALPAPAPAQGGTAPLPPASVSPPTPTTDQYSDTADTLEGKVARVPLFGP